MARELEQFEHLSTEFDQVRSDFRELLRYATRDNLKKLSNGTRWTNEQLLFHMLFGFMIVRTLLPLVHLLGRLPDPISRAYARFLSKATRPFDWVNYAGAVVGSRVINHRRMANVLDHTLAAIERRRLAETPRSLGLGMHFPVRWDPFFKDWMTAADVYLYPMQHYYFHRRQLTLVADETPEVRPESE